MTQYITLNVKLSNSQLNKIKLEIKTDTEVTEMVLKLKISPNSLGDSNNMNNFPHKSLLTNTQTQLYKIGQSGGFLGRLLRPLLKTGLPLLKNVLC